MDESRRSVGVQNRAADAGVVSRPTIFDPTSELYIGRWNQLVSTTNWRKGQIIHQWREALTLGGAPAAEYSDEAWSRLVGGVTSQHVGRLRRVYQRFAQTYEEYEGLYWSHFQAALEWDDAEMWLEGAVQNRWSVSRMRRHRWETLGRDPATEPSDDPIELAQLDEDFERAVDSEPLLDTITGSIVEAISGSEAQADVDEADADDGEYGAAMQMRGCAEETVELVRPFADMGELPDDLAEAFEAFKLAILRHKADAWQQISCKDVLASLDALKELAVAPS